MNKVIGSDGIDIKRGDYVKNTKSGKIGRACVTGNTLGHDLKVFVEDIGGSRWLLENTIRIQKPQGIEIQIPKALSRTIYICEDRRNGRVLGVTEKAYHGKKESIYAFTTKNEKLHVKKKHLEIKDKFTGYYYETPPGFDPLPLQGMQQVGQRQTRKKITGIPEPKKKWKCRTCGKETSNRLYCPECRDIILSSQTEDNEGAYGSKTFIRKAHAKKVFEAMDCQGLTPEYQEIVKRIHGSLPKKPPDQKYIRYMMENKY